LRAAWEARVTMSSSPTWTVTAERIINPSRGPTAPSTLGITRADRMIGRMRCRTSLVAGAPGRWWGGDGWASVLLADLTGDGRTEYLDVGSADSGRECVA
jgi:hypothetical protein